MNEIDSIANPINWFEGMLLSPLHFQQQDRRMEQMLHQVMRQVCPFYWGTMQLKWDNNLIKDGIFRVDSLEAIMPDGLMATYDGNSSEETLELDFKASLENDTDNEELKKTDAKSETVVTIYLILPLAGNEPSNPKAKSARYRWFDDKSVVDQNSGLNGFSIRRLRPQLRLSVNRPQGNQTGFPIARIKVDGIVFAEVTDFTPPSLRLGKDTNWGEKLSKLIRDIRAKAEQISNIAESQKSVLDQYLTLEYHRKIQHLVMGLPELDGLLRSNVAHPFQIYNTLSRIIGHVAMLAPRSMPPSMTEYDHDDIGRSFKKSYDFIRKAAAEITLAYNVVKLKVESDWTFTINLKSYIENFEGKLVFGVIAPEGVRDLVLRKWMDGCIIASDDKKEDFREKRAYGAERKYIEKDDVLGIESTNTRLLYSVNLTADTYSENSKLFFQHSMEGKTGLPAPKNIVLYLRNTDSIDSNENKNQAFNRR